MEKVSVVGLGYVGLPLAQQSSRAGYSVSGIDTNTHLISRLKESGDRIFADLSNNYSTIGDSNIIVICVPTPIYKNKQPNLKCINNALEHVGKKLSTGQLVVVESTVFPGYCQSVGVKILEDRSGLIAGKDFYFAHCPERINPGDSKWNITNISRVIGATDKVSSVKAQEFYSNITSGSIHIMNNVSEAEATKMVENAFRDVNIAFANEMAESFDDVDIDIVEVVNGAATKPFGYMPFYPGLGVGGHCVPVDPEYLIRSADKRGFSHKLLKTARDINDAVVDRVLGKLKSIPGEHKVSLFGLAYKPDISDTRESQALRLRDKLLKNGYLVKSYDPFVDSSTQTILQALEGADVVIIATAHSEFKGMEDAINQSSNINTVFDAVNLIDKNRLENANYVGIGRR